MSVRLFFIAVETDSVFKKLRRGEMKTEIEKNGNENDDRNGD